jgi:hypothetical protein
MQDDEECTTEQSEHDLLADLKLRWLKHHMPNFTANLCGTGYQREAAALLQTELDSALEDEDDPCQWIREQLAQEGAASANSDSSATLVSGLFPSSSDGCSSVASREACAPDARPLLALLQDVRNIRFETSWSPWNAAGRLKRLRLPCIKELIDDIEAHVGAWAHALDRLAEEVAAGAVSTSPPSDLFSSASASPAAAAQTSLSPFPALGIEVLLLLLRDPLLTPPMESVTEMHLSSSDSRLRARMYHLRVLLEAVSLPYEQLVHEHEAALLPRNLLLELARNANVGLLRQVLNPEAAQVAHRKERQCIEAGLSDDELARRKQLRQAAVERLDNVLCGHSGVGDDECLECVTGALLQASRDDDAEEAQQKLEEQEECPAATLLVYQLRALQTWRPAELQPVRYRSKLSLERVVLGRIIAGSTGAGNDVAELIVSFL